MTKAEPTPFAAEGPCRAGVRSALCLQGWPWHDADRAASEVVGAALRIVGTVRPTWQQGQPEWTQDGIMAVEYVCCRNCSRPLEAGHYKFCSSTCLQAYRWRHDGRWLDEHYLAQRAAAKAARLERRPIFACEHCGTGFKSKYDRQKFCCASCAQLAQKVYCASVS
ncbi:hypothetical protein [Ancylobacter vacuolatus]|uniref:Endogenous inhibitor of DNA gyrase (YacG/DUF329 family) n=1 Tax=Ancylobacter vacuolatus TaxID=223389 RepID=A0ABU0DHG1_9HYPH|nr:hypothetical protein [Ancylobacter vacuolatus]MDQ0347868.1 endogenous inhibitor of DNA gyrase (YacG/DUF329 family) [Ancylobacter vacuolatus]